MTEVLAAMEQHQVLTELAHTTQAVVVAVLIQVRREDLTLLEGQAALEAVALVELIRGQVAALVEPLVARILVVAGAVELDFLKTLVAAQAVQVLSLFAIRFQPYRL